ARGRLGALDRRSTGGRFEDIGLERVDGRAALLASRGCLGVGLGTTVHPWGRRRRRRKGSGLTTTATATHQTGQQGDPDESDDRRDGEEFLELGHSCRLSQIRNATRVTAVLPSKEGLG